MYSIVYTEPRHENYSKVFNFSNVEPVAPPDEFCDFRTPLLSPDVDNAVESGQFE